jgi:hypothetical protein
VHAANIAFFRFTNFALKNHILACRTQRELHAGLVWVFILSTLNSPPKHEEEPIKQNNKIEILKLVFKTLLSKITFWRAVHKAGPD